MGTYLLKQEVIKSENKQAFPAYTQTEALFLPSDTQTLPVYINTKKKKKKRVVDLNRLISRTFRIKKRSPCGGGGGGGGGEEAGVSALGTLP